MTGQQSDDGKTMNATAFETIRPQPLRGPRLRSPGEPTMPILGANGEALLPSDAAVEAKAADDAKDGRVSLQMRSVFNAVTCTGAVRIELGPTVHVVPPAQAQAIGMLLITTAEAAIQYAAMRQLMDALSDGQMPAAAQAEAIRQIVPDARQRHAVLAKVAAGETPTSTPLTAPDQQGDVPS